MNKLRGCRGAASLVLLAALLPDCGKTEKGGSSESHFLALCTGSCPSGLSCICGVCTKPCSDDAVCAELSPDASCTGSSACESAPGSGMACDVTCEEDRDCAALGRDSACVDGRCRPRLQGAYRVVFPTSVEVTGGDVDRPPEEIVGSEARLDLRRVGEAWQAVLSPPGLPSVPMTVELTDDLLTLAGDLLTGEVPELNDDCVLEQHRWSTVSLPRGPGGLSGRGSVEGTIERDAVAVPSLSWTVRGRAEVEEGAALSTTIRVPASAPEGDWRLPWDPIEVRFSGGVMAPEEVELRVSDDADTSVATSWEWETDEAIAWIGARAATGRLLDWEGSSGRSLRVEVGPGLMDWRGQVSEEVFGADVTLLDIGARREAFDFTTGSVAVDELGRWGNVGMEAGDESPCESAACLRVGPTRVTTTGPGIPTWSDVSGVAGHVAAQGARQLVVRYRVEWAEGGAEASGLRAVLDVAAPGYGVVATEPLPEADEWADLAVTLPEGLEAESLGFAVRADPSVVRSRAQALRCGLDWFVVPGALTIFVERIETTP